MRSLSLSAVKLLLLAAVCAQIQKCHHKKPYVSLGCEMLLALVCLVTIVSCYGKGSMLLNEM